MSVASIYQSLVDLPQAHNVCNTIGLPKLVDYWPAMLGLSIVFQALRLLSDPVSLMLFGKRYGVLSRRQKYDWGVRVVSEVHAIAVVVLSIPIFFSETLLNDTIYGFDHYAACVYTIVCGYFLWDIFVSISDYKRLGLGFVIHAVSSFGVFIMSFRPSLQYYGAGFIMFEVSTIFLNINWWLDKLGMTGSNFQMYNASLLLFFYLTVRIIFGTYFSYQLFEDLKANGHNMSSYLYYFYRVSNTAILILSYYWFYLMIYAVKKRFSGGNKKAQKKKKAE